MAGPYDESPEVTNELGDDILGETFRLQLRAAGAMDTARRTFDALIGAESALTISNIEIGTYRRLLADTNCRIRDLVAEVESTVEDINDVLRGGGDVGEVTVSRGELRYIRDNLENAVNNPRPCGCDGEESNE